MAAKQQLPGFVFILIMMVASLPIFIFGYLLRFKKVLSLISGYSPEKYADPDGLARWTGTGCFLLGGLMVLHGLLYLLFPEYKATIGFAAGAVIFVVAIGLAIGTRRYRR